MSFFSIISIAFIAYLFYYSDALAEEKNKDNLNFRKETLLHKLSFLEEMDFNRENNSTAEQDTIVKSFSVDSKGTLTVDVSVGDVELKTWDKNEVKVIVQRKGSESILEDHKLSFESTRNSVTIKSENKTRIWNWGFGKKFSINFIMFVPQQFYPDIKTSGGDISITDLLSDSKVRTSGGDININNSTGNCDIKTSGGDIKISSNKGNIKASTSGGDIVVKQTKGNVDVSTSGGDIVFKEIDGSVNATTSGGDIEAEILGENKGVSLSTSGGDIDLKFTSAIKADIECRTSGGSVSLNNNSNFEGTVKSSSIVGKLNGGGPLIKARSSGGDIDLKFNK
jgi:hypothetical protein